MAIPMMPPGQNPFYNQQPGTSYFGEPVPADLQVQQQALSLGALPQLPQAPMQAPPKGFIPGLFGGEVGTGDPNMDKRLGTRSLFDAGLAMLAASGPNPAGYKRGIGEILATGVQAGRGRWAAGAGALQEQAQKQLDVKKQQLKQQILSRYSGRTDMQSLTGLMSDLIATGFSDDPSVKSLAEVIKSMQSQKPDWKPVVVDDLEANGRKAKLLLWPDGTQTVLDAGAAEKLGLTPAQQAAQFRSDRAYRAQNIKYLSTSFGKRIGDMRNTRDTIDRALSFASQAAVMKGIGRNQLLVAFVKAIDPGSVAREGEVTLARQFGNMYAGIAQQLKRIANGEQAVVSDQQVTDLIEVLSRNRSWFEQKIGNTGKSAMRLGKQLDLQENEIKEIVEAGAEMSVFGGGYVPGGYQAQSGEMYGGLSAGDLQELVNSIPDFDTTGLGS